MPDLKNLITEQVSLLQRLKTNLETELHLISTRDAEALTNIINEKSKLLDSIAAIDKQLEARYESEMNEALSPLFEQAKTLLEECKYFTQINAKAVEQGQLRLDHLRNLLLEARAKESMTYDKSGKPRGGASFKGISA